MSRKVPAGRGGRNGEASAKRTGTNRSIETEEEERPEALDHLRNVVPKL